MDVMKISEDFPVMAQLRMENSAFIPNSFYKSLEGFCNRNAIPVEVFELGKLKTQKELCMQCVKAFILDQAITRYHMSIDIIALAIKIDSEIGHSKYYMDDGELKKI